MVSEREKIALILESAELGPFESLIGQLTSAANEQRSHAESLFILGCDLHPDALALKLVAVLDASPALDFRAMSVVHLRILLTHRDSRGSFWLRLSPASQTSLKSLLLVVLQQEPDRSTAKKVADTISAFDLLPDSTWPDLLPFLFHAVAASNVRPCLQEYALLIIAQIAYVLVGDASFVVSHLPTLSTLLLAALSHPSSSNVRVAALSVAINLVTSLKSAFVENILFVELGYTMMRTFVDFVDSGDEDYLQEVLKLFIDIAVAWPQFFSFRSYDGVARVMMHIVEAAQHEEDTQDLSGEFINTLAEARAGAGPGADAEA
ncbi:uncharacterized protein LOC121972116 [Zingiber officinale]|uniref:uncharacterized protein LOC121972116 n=1 Tax=Zingiber officinale TaxID=94328 RepID=UPI001C4B7FB5|nr:uncharacterized protein LOC121972116 [Zingiber officinale]XP_042379694.1 uncharacterized protein LOC121972116 [Zingiber officinale]